jgi:esterase/lipase
MLLYCLSAIITYNLLNKYKQKLYFYPSTEEINTPHKIIKINDSYALTNVNKHKIKSRCVLISHGNAGNISFRDYLFNEFENVNCDVYCYEYCGFGKCPGDISINNCVKEHLFWLNYLDNKYEQIDLYGESIGGAIVIETLSKINNKSIENKIKNIYLDRTFNKLGNIIKKLNSTIGTIYNILLFNDLNTNENIFKNKNMLINKNIYIIHSKLDEIIPYEEAMTNYHRCLELKIRTNLIEISGTHNKPIYNNKYHIAIKN